jgi:hypothetical protein
MTNIPNDSIIGRVEDMMKGDGKLNHTQTGTKVTPRRRNRVEEKFSQLICQCN